MRALLMQVEAVAARTAAAARQSPDDDVIAPSLEALRDLFHFDCIALDSMEIARVIRAEPPHRAVA